ncbi:hypothetical protein Back2_13570 [Nocardioides baekrokdamisoli]|uniref:HPr kinase n=1 Tax=Nocardioides baekrokdamisoli TaxID=1804624 RepID=A0A3G9IDL8_9ACTN|nr:hypothetical protein [Nocardioides baekrokdamisoli]BBH17070.1 hypothetical protein Back2_13570 [Nocardioides baekrokdamisoli]
MTWTKLSSRAYGCAVSIYAAEHVDVREHLPFWWREEELEAEQHVAIHPGDDIAGMIHELEFWVAEHATEAVFIHAGVVAVNGAALLLPGMSRVGKSSLVAALLRHGASYGSDEYALLTPDGLVHAYPRRLVMRTPEGLHRVDATDLGASSVMEPARIHAIADLTFEDGSDWAVAPISRSAAAMRLLDNAVAARRRPYEVLAAVTDAVATAPVTVAGRRGDADSAAIRLLEMLG